MPNHPFIRDLPSLGSSLLESVIKSTLKHRLFSTRRTVRRAKGPPLLVLNSLLISYLAAEGLTADFQSSRGRTIRDTLVSTILVKGLGSLKVIDSS